MQVILVMATCLGFFSFMEMIENRRANGRFDAVRITVGVTVFLSAATFMFQRSGTLACMLLLLLAWLIYDVAGRLCIRSRAADLFPWFGFMFLLAYVFLVTG